jgi:hypothetical protein
MKGTNIKIKTPYRRMKIKQEIDWQIDDIYEIVNVAYEMRDSEKIIIKDKLAVIKERTTELFYNL